MDTLKGQFLVATPDIGDERFAEAVIYLVAHGDDGAMGLVVNQPMDDLNLSDILAEIDLDDEEDAIRIPERLLRQSVFKGGPVDASRGFVLHTSDYFRDGNSFAVDGEVCLTATLDVLRAMMSGNGPDASLLALGYCEWTAGQLEDELRTNGWLTAASSKELLFSLPASKKYEAALAALGVTRATLSPVAGNA
ncbi:YqgE/AlgH family protein [Pelagibacterium sp.]|uniref:YqgE/AlgH family protein n=1 Tax=Pelagibacterium sp. TaxID=1967288 RepID=UPI003A93B03A